MLIVREIKLITSWEASEFKNLGLFVFRLKLPSFLILLSDTIGFQGKKLAVAQSPVVS